MKKNALRSKAPMRAAIKRTGRTFKKRGPQAAQGIRKPFRRELQLLADIADESRLSLSSILMMNGLVLETPLGPEQRALLEKAHASAESLMNLLNDLLDYYRMEARDFTLESIDFDLRTTLEETIEELAAQARQKGLELAHAIHPDVPSLLVGDPGRLRQILTHFASHALMITEKGEIVIQVTLEGESKTRATIHFAVMNSGPGIPLRLKRQLFGFLPLQEYLKRKRRVSLGIGLAISRRLVEMMGGQVGVESQRGQGSTLWFTGSFIKQSKARKDLWMPAESLKGQRVLIVDDLASSRQILREQLSAAGCLPDEATSGEEALVKLRQAREGKNSYAVAILSKELDGAALGRQIKEDPNLSSTLLVLLTSQGNRGDGRLMQKIGFSVYLTKPVESSQLCDCLALALGRKYRAGLTEFPLITRHSLAEEKKQRIRILLVEDDVGIQKKGLQILQKIGYGADLAANGKEALSALEKTAYDLILMDVEMPEMDGLQATAAIRQKEKETGRHIPIVGMTTRAGAEDRELCLRAGMDDYILKPIHAIDIVDILDQFVSEGV